MSLEEFFSGRKAPVYLQSLADCLSSIGTEDFNANFLGLIENVIKADQCMIFSYKDERPECYLSFSKRYKKIAINQAQKYLRGGFRDDPLRETIAAAKETGGTKIVNLSDLQSEMPENYFETFFLSCEIIDSISIVTSHGDDTLLLNFYRYQENKPFVISDNSLRVPFWTTISRIALMHYSNSGDQDLRSPLNSLSKREKDICEAMLNGLTSDAIAWNLDISPSTVKTYRQRAYSKLGINSKTALFALCKNNG